MNDDEFYSQLCHDKLKSITIKSPYSYRMTIDVCDHCESLVTYNYIDKDEEENNG